MKRLLVSGFVLACGAQVNAQEVVYTPAATEACFANIVEGQNPDTCIGVSALACMEANEGGMSTVGMGDCLNRELEYWDARLNDIYHRVRAAAKATDTEMEEIGASVASQADAMRDMQRAWIAYRDATCEYERTMWGGGTGGGPATVACHMKLTAEQALYFEAQEGVN